MNLIVIVLICNLSLIIYFTFSLIKSIKNKKIKSRENDVVSYEEFPFIYLTNVIATFGIILMFSVFSFYLLGVLFNQVLNLNFLLLFLLGFPVITILICLIILIYTGKFIDGKYYIPCLYRKKDKSKFYFSVITNCLCAICGIIALIFLFKFELIKF